MIIGCWLGATGVAAGAFGAHGLESYLAKQAQAESTVEGVQAGDSSAQTPQRRLHTFEVAVRYQIYHALALVAVGLVGLATSRRGAANLAGWLFLIGVAIFSGLLYALVLSGQRWLGAIVPIGGVSLIAGWVALAWAAAGTLPDRSDR